MALNRGVAIVGIDIDPKIDDLSPGWRYGYIPDSARLYHDGTASSSGTAGLFPENHVCEVNGRSTRVQVMMMLFTLIALITLMPTTLIAFIRVMRC